MSTPTRQNQRGTPTAVSLDALSRFSSNQGMPFLLVCLTLPPFSPAMEPVERPIVFSALMPTSALKAAKYHTFRVELDSAEGTVQSWVTKSE
jgi:hypothetical protein